MEGQNIVFEFRSAEGQLDRLAGLAAELVQLKVDVIVTLYVPPSLAAKHATREIPIVAIVGDPVETGIVSSLARPGGNITGVSLMASALAGKSVELFRDMIPSARRVGVLGHATNPVFAKSMLDEILRMRAKLKMLKAEMWKRMHQPKSGRSRSWPSLAICRASRTRAS